MRLAILDGTSTRWGGLGTSVARGGLPFEFAMLHITTKHKSFYCVRIVQNHTTPHLTALQTYVTDTNRTQRLRNIQIETRKETQNAVSHMLFPRTTLTQSYSGCVESCLLHVCPKKLCTSRISSTVFISTFWAKDFVQQDIYSILGSGTGRLFYHLQVCRKPVPHHKHTAHTQCAYEIYKQHVPVSSVNPLMHVHVAST